MKLVALLAMFAGALGSLLADVPIAALFFSLAFLGVLAMVDRR